jgi:hypothetical protein
MPEPNDDPIAIPDQTRLYRRINPEWTVYDRNLGEWRPTSQNFQDSQDGTPMSVYAENIAITCGESPQDFLRGRWSEWHLAAVTAGRMRLLHQSVYCDPANQDPDDFHPSHAAVRGPKDGKMRPKLGREYEWIVPPKNRHDPTWSPCEPKN